MGRIHPKVAGGTLAGAIVVILVYIVHVFAHIDVPAEVAAAITTVVGFVIMYFVPSQQLGGQVVALSQRQAGP